MKFAMLAALTIQLLALDAHAQTPTREDLRKTVEHIQRIAKDAVKEAEETRARNAYLALQVADGRAALALSQAAVVKLDSDVLKLTNWGVDQQRAKDKAQADLATSITKYHRLKFWAALIVGIFAALAAMQLGPLLALAGPYGAIVPLAAGVGGFALIWFLS